VRAGDLVTYPDVTVACGPVERDPADASTLLNPTVVVEVTSQSSEEYDRGEKLDRYRQIPSLRAVLIVSHRERHFELWRRSDQGWTKTEAAAGERLKLGIVECELDADEVYRTALDTRS
jgi:Uma2 family endonuclease